MSTRINDNLILSREESENLINALSHPDLESSIRLQNFLKSFDEVKINQRDQFTTILDIPDLEIDFLSDKIYREYNSVKKTTFNNEVNYTYNVRYTNNSIKVNDCFMTFEKEYVLQKNINDSHGCEANLAPAA